tara:strand:+ start:1490 stop:2191 length:702 start_codon:yes stop_codon:yes gene_type:complete
MNYAFDVDGTLGEARQIMDPDFKRWFMQWMRGKNVYLVTGSDRAKTVEQIGQDLVDRCTMSFQCAGNSVWQNGVEVSSTKLNVPPEMIHFLEEKVAATSYPDLYGNHIEIRPGLINFSIVGRNAVGNQRDDYYTWDQKHKEREQIAEEFNNRFIGFEAEVGGNTSLDIHLKGRNKAQVYDVIGAPLVFFGDRIFPGGNDYPLHCRMIGPQDKSHPVTSASETWNLLKEYYNHV